MDREEWILTVILASLILAGIAYETFRGADKNAEIVITHPGKTPFDLSPTYAAASILPAATGAIVSLPTYFPIQTLDPKQKALLLFLNSASPNQLEDLPGIGKVLAKRILDYRQKFGLFRQVEEVLKVNGIGEAKLEEMLQYFAIPQSPTLQPFHPLINLPSPITYPPIRKIPPPPLRLRRLLSLNQATKEQLMDLPGIGESLADAILHAKQEKRGFHSWQDVENIPGIGKHRTDLLKSHFVVP